MKYFILLLPLAYAQAYDGITITIEPGPTEANTTIKHEGEDIKVVTESDITAFNLTKDNLDNAVEKFAGAKATDIFIKSPTPWDDLYKSYNWKEVKREFKVKEIKLINVTTEERTLSIEEFTNRGRKIKNMKESVFEGYNIFASRHYWSGNEDVSARIRYAVIRPYNPMLRYKYQSEVGQNIFDSGINVTSYKETTAKFNLEPGQTAKFYVKATEVKAGVMVEYETSLTGVAAVNFANKHEGHYFWSYEINSVMAAANMASVLKTNEYVEVKYLTDYEAQVKDASSGMDIKFT